MNTPLDRLNVEVYKAELVKSNRALVRYSRKNKVLRWKVKILREEVERLSAPPVWGIIQRFNAWKNKNKNHGESTLPTAPPLS